VQDAKLNRNYIDVKEIMLANDALKHALKAALRVPW